MADIVIRLATESDLEDIGRLWLNLVQYHNAIDDRMPVAAEGGCASYQRRVRAQFSSPEVRTLVADLNGQLVGFVLGALVDLRAEMFVREKSGHVADIFVEEAYRGCGVGRKLINELVDWFRLNGVQQIEWSVATRNTSGHAFWEAIGGRAVMVRMRLDL